MGRDSLREGLLSMPAAVLTIGVCVIHRIEVANALWPGALDSQLHTLKQQELKHCLLPMLRQDCRVCTVHNTCRDVLHAARFINQY